MNWETCTKLNLTHLCQKSLPQLDEQIKKLLWDTRNELKECEGGPPQDPKGAKQFLTQVGSHIITSCWWLLQICLLLWISVQAESPLCLFWFSPPVFLWRRTLKGSRSVRVSSDSLFNMPHPLLELLPHFGVQATATFFSPVHVYIHTFYWHCKWKTYISKAICNSYIYMQLKKIHYTVVLHS